MPKFTRAALVAALLTGATVMVAVPAQAKKKDEAPAAPQPKLSESYRKLAKPAETAIAAKDVAAADPAVAALEAAAQTDDEKYYAQRQRLTVESMRLNQTTNGDGVKTLQMEGILKAPLDALLANPSTPKTELGYYNYLRGSIAFDSSQYREALVFYQRAKELNYQSENLGLQIIKSQVETGDVQTAITALNAYIDSETAAGKVVEESYYRYAVAKLNNAKLHAQTVQALMRYLKAYPTSKAWRESILTYAFEANSVQLDKSQRVDMFRLLMATNSIDQALLEEYAQTAVDIGVPVEAKTVIEKGRASGKLPATAAADQMQQAQKSIAADRPLAAQETSAKAAADGLYASQVGDAYLGAGNYAKAIEMYGVALSKGAPKVAGKRPFNPNAINLHLGIAQALGGDKTAAQATFATVQTAPYSEIAQFWSVYASNPAPAAAPAATPAS